MQLLLDSKAHVDGTNVSVIAEKKMEEKKKEKKVDSEPWAWIETPD